MWQVFLPAYTPAASLIALELLEGQDTWEYVRELATLWGDDLSLAKEIAAHPQLMLSIRYVYPTFHQQILLSRYRPERLSRVTSTVVCKRLPHYINGSVMIGLHPPEGRGLASPCDVSIYGQSTEWTLNGRLLYIARCSTLTVKSRYESKYSPNWAVPEDADRHDYPAWRLGGGQRSPHKSVTPIPGRVSAMVLLVNCDRPVVPSRPKLALQIYRRTSRFLSQSRRRYALVCILMGRFITRTSCRLPRSCVHARPPARTAAHHAGEGVRRPTLTYHFITPPGVSIWRPAVLLKLCSLFHDHVDPMGREIKSYQEYMGCATCSSGV
ncbi:hypothetical protein J6590_055384 [Homalodisca vitripennis]|nr:hypothetical protein J6590_055384 [Homalodisca vitripennis]